MSVHVKSSERFLRINMYKICLIYHILDHIIMIHQRAWITSSLDYVVFSIIGCINYQLFPCQSNGTFTPTSNFNKCPAPL